MQIVFMPYLFLDQIDEIIIERVKIWDFDKSATKYIPDEALRNHIKRIINSHIYNNKPVEGAGILTIGQSDFRPLTRRDYLAIKRAQSLLFLAFIRPADFLPGNDNSGFAMRTSDNFDISIQNFVPGDNNIASTNGYIVTATKGGYKLGEVTYAPPLCLQKPFFNCKPDKELIEKIVGIKSHSKKLFGQIVAATELLRQSYYNSETNLSSEARILLQMASFEKLLGLGDPPRRDFKDNIEKLTILHNEKKYQYFYETRKGRQKECRTIRGVWADRYYTLRNHIIHGESISKREWMFRGTARHFDIATAFFVLLVKKIINDTYNTKIFYDEIVWHRKSLDDIVKRGFEYETNKLRRAIEMSIPKA